MYDRTAFASGLDGVINSTAWATGNTASRTLLLENFLKSFFGENSDIWDLIKDKVHDLCVFIEGLMTPPPSPPPTSFIGWFEDWWRATFPIHDLPWGLA